MEPSGFWESDDAGGRQDRLRIRMMYGVEWRAPHVHIYLKPQDVL